MTKGVIVLGGHVQGLGIIRIFGENGIPVILLDENIMNLGKHSKYCLRFFKINADDLINFLFNILPADTYRNWLLVPTNDFFVKILSKNKPELEKFYKVSVGDWETVNKCYDKRLTYRIAVEIGITIPKTILLEDVKDTNSIDIDFPCIIKPAVMHTFYKKVKSKVLVCYSKKDLQDKISFAAGIIPPEEIIIQEIIPGDSENQYSVCYFYNKDEPVVTLEARRKRQHPPDFGNATTYAETVFIPELLATSAKLLSYINFWGICEVEYKYDVRDKKFKLLEVNPRTWKWHYISKISKSPFLLSLYNAIYNNKPIYSDKWEECSWQHLTTDISAIARQLVKNKSVFSFSKRKQHAVFDINDILPSIFEILYLPYLVFSR